MTRSRLLRWALGLILVGILLVALGLGWAWRQWTGRGPAPEPGQPTSVLVEIPAGMTLRAAADTLENRGLIRDARILLAGARLEGQDKGLRSGLYRLEVGASPRRLLADLTSGRSVQIKITIPEGLDALAAADILAEKLELSRDTLLAAADSVVQEYLRSEPWPGAAAWQPDYLAELQLASTAVSRTFRLCEGYLAPDTYHFGAGTDPATVAGHLVDHQLQRLKMAFAGEFRTNPQVANPHQLLTLASIVEAEARLPRERRAIAAVYTNRLIQGWRLEADPTVAFILDKKGKRLFYRDLAVDSPFNTYRRGGLPPGPIGNPGEAAIRAAAAPDPVCDAMFFVSDGQGGHVFSRTAREHQAAVERFRQIKAQERRQGRH